MTSTVDSMILYDTMTNTDKLQLIHWLTERIVLHTQRQCQ